MSADTEGEDDAAGEDFFRIGVTELVLVGTAVVVAKNAFSTTNGSNTTLAAGGGLSGGCGCIGVTV